MNQCFCAITKTNQPPFGASLNITQTVIFMYNFDTQNKSEATAALIVYAVYRSRDRKRFKVTPEMWGQIDRFVKASAKRARTIPEFIDSFMPKMSCAGIHPKAMEVALAGRLIKVGDSFMEFNQGDKRTFLTQVVTDCDEAGVMKKLYKETSWIIMLVRDRLEQEKPIEKSIEIDDGDLV